MKAYYERRAREYDDWCLGRGLFAANDRAGWHEELRKLGRTLAALPPARVLDVACGTGFLTRHLRGEVTGLDQGEAMLAIAREQAPNASFVRGDALALPSPTGRSTGSSRATSTDTLARASGDGSSPRRRGVAPELVVVDSALRDGIEPSQLQERLVADSSRFWIFKRYFTTDQLAEEVGGGRVLYAGRWFVAVAS